MNIFENFLKEIKVLIIKNKNILKLNELNNFLGVTVESPPPQFDFDLSCNISLILGKKNNLNPKDLASKIRILILKNNTQISKVEIAGPGFLNIKLSNELKQLIILSILKNKNLYGSAIHSKKYNVEFVSANPTGPMHVGHCRGAIFGDVLANLLKFNGNIVTKE